MATQWSDLQLAEANALICARFEHRWGRGIEATSVDAMGFAITARTTLVCLRCDRVETDVEDLGHVTSES